MANESSAAVLRHVQTIFRAGSSGSLTDGQLLDRYRSGDPDAAEAAFAALVERHAGMVFALGRAVLGDPHDAEDALQATFLVLAKRARSIREPGSVAGWLARVARRVATRAKARAAVRRAREREAARREAGWAMNASPESYAELYEEIDRLPAKFRGPVVLCDLEGLSYEQAAGQLLVPVGTVRSRLARARGRLGARLKRRGLVPGAVATGLGPRPAPPLATTEAILRAAMDLAANRPIAGAISAEAVRLASSYLRSRRMVRMGMVGMTLISAGLVALGAGVRATSREPAAVAAEASAIAEAPAPAAGTIFARVVDVKGRPVPGQDVHALRWYREPETLKTDAGGVLRIPEDIVRGRQFVILIAMTDEKTIGWASLGAGTEDLARGTADDPLTLTLRPRDDPVTGMVVDRGGKPIAGVEVSVEQMRDETNGLVMGYGVTFPGWPIVAVTDNHGRYTIPLPRGTGGGLRVRHRRYAGPYLGFNAEREPIGPTTLEPAGSIVGVVTDAATGRPVARASVGAQALEHRGKILGGGWGEATTDDRGRFEIGGLSSGVYNLLFLDGPEGRRRTMTAPAVEGVRVKIDQDAKADLAAIEGRKLRGSVIDAETKAPLAGVQIGSYGTARPRSGAACMSVRTDATGRFELSVPPGPTYVYIMDRHRGANSSELDVSVPADRDPEPVKLLGTPMDPVERPIAKARAAEAPKAAVKAVIRQDIGDDPMQPKGPVTLLTGRVVDPEGKPVPGVRIYHNGKWLVESVTDREGEFIMEDLPEGALQISLQKQGYRTSIERLGADVGTVVLVLHPRPNGDRKPAPAPPDLPANLRLLDIQPLANEPLDKGPLPDGEDLAELPLGVRKLGGTWYSVGPMMIHLRASLQARLPKSAQGIKVGPRCARLHFLHGTQYEVPDRTKVGHYTVHYADGFSEEIPIVYGEDLSVWTTWKGGPGKASLANLAWKGKNQRTELSPEAFVYLFEMAWTNPHPDKEIATIDFESAVTDCSPFLIAVTAETR